MSKQSIIILPCKNCENQLKFRKHQLENSIGKETFVFCKKCNSKSNYFIDENLLKQKGKSGPKTEIALKTKDFNEKKPTSLFKLKFINFGNSEAQYYDLQIGINEIGRQPDSIKGSNKIKLNTKDKAISRSHFIIYVSHEKDQYEYLINDNDSSNKLKLEFKGNVISLLSSQEKVYLNVEIKIYVGQSIITLSEN